MVDAGHGCRRAAVTIHPNIVTRKGLALAMQHGYGLKRHGNATVTRL
jgi:hypothetical protein